MYRGKNLLPDKRRQDECYYRTHITITPLFGAGQTIDECKEVCKEIESVFYYLDFRMPLPEQGILANFKDNLKRLQQKWHCNNHNKSDYSVSRLLQYLN